MGTILQKISKLRGMKVPELIGEYETAFGKPPRVKNREYLVKRIAWRIQEQRYGGLGRAACRRLESLIEEIDLPIQENQRTATGKLRRPPSPSNPAVGTTLTRIWHGVEHQVQILDTGCEWEGTVYSSLSATARAITGQAWSGPLFFGLRKRGKK